MRLFIAINFSAKTRSRLAGLRDELSAASTKGRFSAAENLHLTLAFLGECGEKQAGYAKSAMDEIGFRPFEIRIDRIGRFRRSGGDTWWAGVKESEDLTNLHRELTKKLTEFGFRLEERKFSPHITLGREILTSASPRGFEAFGQTADKIELMRSERIAGKLTYTAIYETGAGAYPRR